MPTEDMSGAMAAPASIQQLIPDITALSLFECGTCNGKWIL